MATAWTYEAGFLPGHVANEYMNRLVTDELAPLLKTHTVKVFGKEHPIPRKTCLLQSGGGGQQSTRGYTYSGHTQGYDGTFTPTIRAIAELVEARTGFQANAVLVNLYEDGNHKVGWHSDDEKDLADARVFSVSLGATRKFYFRRRDDHTRQYKMVLEDGSLLGMKEDCQRVFQHTVPREKTVKEPRLNLTFRKMHL